MLQSLRERLTLALIILLPFHAFAVTVLTRIIAGPNHAPIGLLALWKEMLLGVILIIALVEIFYGMRSGQRSAVSGQKVRIDSIDSIIVTSIVLGIIVSTFHFPFLAPPKLLGSEGGSIFHFAYGVKYDFLPLIAFLILRRVPWSSQFMDRVLRSILIVGVIVAVYGIITFFLPQSFFVRLGYLPYHSLYFSDGPIAAFQMIGNTTLRRIQSVMSGPNQLGLWLLIPLSVGLVKIFQRKVISDQRSAISALVLVGIALLLTFSRSAWIGAFAMVIVALGSAIPAQARKRIIVGFVSAIAIIGVILLIAFPSVFGRLGSTRGHLEKPLEAIQIMIAHPFGLGLGTAGPASNRGTDACIVLRLQDDPSWAKTIPSLCVFLGTRQVQPTDRICNCPLLTENWYLQWGVEMGVIGFVLSLVLVILVLRKLIIENGKLKIISGISSHKFSIYNLHFSIFLVFLGLSLAALFLHAWEDAAVAYTVWVMLSVALPSGTLRSCLQSPVPSSSSTSADSTHT